MPNDAENDGDMDEDGIPNAFDLDSDGDGISDLVEAGGVLDADGDGRGTRRSMPTGRELLSNVDELRSIPGLIVQGRYDVVCPVKSAWNLHQRWPEADLRIVAESGHSAGEPGIVHELVMATDRFRSSVR